MSIADKPLDLKPSPASAPKLTPERVDMQHCLQAANLGLHSVYPAPRGFFEWIAHIFRCVLGDYLSYSLEEGKTYFVERGNFVGRLEISPNIELNSTNVNALARAYFKRKGKSLDLTDEEILKSPVSKEILDSFPPRNNICTKTYSLAARVRIITSDDPKKALCTYLGTSALEGSLVEVPAFESPIPEILVPLATKAPTNSPRTPSEQ